MKPTRLSLDTAKVEQPQGTNPYGKNGVRLSGIDYNESGFLPSNVTLPYKFIGFIETDTYPIYFSTDNVFSAFGFHNVDTDTYVPIFDDSSLDFKLNFNINRPIKGEYRRNFRNEIELTWIELATAGANPPRWANTTHIGSDLNDFLVFPKSLIPYIDTTIVPGGNLGMGAYFVGVKYIRNDGTETRYTTLTRPLIAFSDNYDTIPGGNTGKALSITLTELDQTYDRIQLVVVERINGVDTPYTLPELPIAPTVTFIYTGAEKQTQLTLDEVLIPAAYYENAKAITQLTDQLFLGNMTEEEIIDWQQYATMVKIRWKSELVNVASRPVIATESGKQRGWMHDEVGAFYIVLLLKNGRNSRAFTVPGPIPISGDLLQSTIATAQSMSDTPVYMVENTCRNINLTDNTGDCGIWINQDESYPDIPQFDATAIGGENLRNQPVRHHRMPSINFCKTTFYNGNSEYGRTYLDTLGLQVSNVIIPAELQDKVSGWELYYAKRDFNNATILGQSLLMFGAQANQDAGSGGGYTSTGGNWSSYQRTHSSGSTTDGESLKLVNDHIRFHAFDILFNRPSINATHLSLQLYHVIDFGGSLNIAANDAHQVNYDLDYTNGQGNVRAPRVPAADNILYKIEGGQYVSNNSTSGDYSNIRLEDAYVAKIPAPNADLMNSAGWTWMRRDYDLGHNSSPVFEGTYLANLCVTRRNVYLSYFSPTLVRTGKVFPATLQASDSTIYGGDTFLGVYTFTTYGLVTRKDIINDTGITDWKTLATDGIKTNHRFICEMVSNGACRYETPGNTYSKFWPKSSMATGTNTFLYNFSRDNSPNQIGYSRDCNAVGDLLNGILTASPYDQFVSESPTKIVRSVKQISESVINSWKNFNALDYYETVKNKGPIINLCGMNDRLIIHHKDAIFITRSKATFQGDIVQVTLGTGDIFQFEPNEVRPAHLGYGGTLNPLACVLTPIGYMYPDNISGELFLFDGSNLVNIGTGLINFFLQYLTVKEINSYIGNGISIGFEQYYKRILLTVKNRKISSNTLVFVPNYEPTSEFFATLTANESVVYKDGRYQLFVGENSSEFECSTDDYPALADYSFTKNEHIPNGSAIGTVTATGGVLPYSYIITTPFANRGGLGIDPLTGAITVIDTNAFDYSLSILVLTVQVTDANGNTDIGTVSVTINHVDSTPVLPAYNVTIPEGTVNGTTVNTEIATNRDGGSITYAIMAGNGLGAFTLNSSTGVITVADQTQLVYATNPLFILTVRATTSVGGTFIDNTCTIYLSYVQVATANVNVTEQADPYADANGQWKSNGVTKGTINATGTATYSILANKLFSSEAFSELPSSGSNPQERHRVYKNAPTPFDSGSLVHDVTIVAEPGGSDIFTDTPINGDIYDVYIESTADAPTSPITCGSSASYSGGDVFPGEEFITIGSGTGTVTLHYDAFSIPDKFEVWYGGVKVIDTGYRGDTSYQSALDTELTSRGLPTETIISGGSGTASFLKSTGLTIALVRIYAPLPGTDWNFTLDCPI